MQYIDRLRLEKRLAIASAVLKTAISITGVLKNSMGVLRKKPRFVNKHLYVRKARLSRRRHIACTVAQLALNSAIGAAQIHMIASVPMPKFKPGSSIKSGIAIIGENGKEEINKQSTNEAGD